MPAEPWGDEARGRSARLRAENQRQRAELAGLRQRLEELERRLGLPSGQPPAGRRTRSQRGRAGQRPGGQPGPRAATLDRTAHPDRVETHRPPRCGRCGAPLAEAATEGQPGRRQVCDRPPPQPLRTRRSPAAAGPAGA